MLKRKKLAKLRRAREKLLATELANKKKELAKKQKKTIKRIPIAVVNARWRQEYLADLRNYSTQVQESSIECVAGIGSRKSIFDSKWKRPYSDNEELAFREAEAMRQADEKATRIAPIWNKGAYQYVGDVNKEDLITLGRKI
jgi:hypothetical protein